ncbi:serine hydrolase domain-containing protein [Marinicella sediminis]|uniref:Beta-lactamase n=1 Tax=Marinicella sediminis TaxID=1792834 RepID=A0ABV7JCR0_9GAMM|nr:serine hydrolase domain-containing protein [Marinicella sediminis]
MKTAVLLLFWVASSHALIPAEVKQQAELRVTHQINPSIALAVYDQGLTDYHVSGWQDLENERQADTGTVYEIGSISKTFTGLLLARMATSSQLSIDDPVEQHWSELVQLRDANDQPITLKQLSTHTSGLPRVPNNMPVFGDDPYGSYDRQLMLEALQTIQPGSAGNRYAYSNLAVGLLGETLANIGRHSFNQLVESHILKPLNLRATYMTLDQVPQEHLAIGYSGQTSTSPWNFQALAGAGSIRSSITDLLAYGVAYLNPPEELSKAMDLATTIHYQQEQLKVGLGWHVRNGVYWHNGGTGGFRSMLMVDPQRGKVVAAITNNSRNDVEDLAIHLMDASQPMREYDFPVPITTDALKVFSGTFQQTGSDRQIVIKLLHDQLFFTAEKQPRQALIYVGDERFKFSMIDVRIQFNQDPQGVIESLDLHGWGEPQKYLKVADQ